MFYRGQNIRDDTQNKNTKHSEFKKLIIYYDDLVNKVLKKKTFNNKQLSEHIFLKEWTEKKENLVFEKRLYAIKKTLERLDNIIQPSNFDKYENFLIILMYDIFPLVEHAEVVKLGNTLDYNFGKRPFQDANETYISAYFTLNLEPHLDYIKDYTREISPISIFLIRQTIEIFGKSLIGFNYVLDKNDNRARISTQTSWAFITKELKKCKPRISIPVDVSTILKIEKWTNSYVHTANLDDLYLIENAIEIIRDLFVPDSCSIKNYNELKNDFQAFLELKRKKNILEKICYKLNQLLNKKEKNFYKIGWLPKDRLIAKIISE